MRSKILITGGGGMLASAIEGFYRKKDVEVFAPTYLELNVLDRLGVADAISVYKPDYVFHTAALHVNDCEEAPEMAFKLNTWATGNLARICQKIETRLVYISSCGYFGDEIKYYSEYDPVVLKTVYARSKYQGEILAVKECERTFAIRPGMLYGGSIKQAKNFVYQRYLEASNKSVIRTAKDKFGSPTYIGDLTEKIDEVLQLDVPGLYHVSNSGGCSRADYVKKIIEFCGLKIKIEPVDSSYFLRKANVPDCEMLDNWNLKFFGIKLLPPWEEAVERYCKIMLKEIGLSNADRSIGY